jgi:hypothetical protein
MALSPIGALALARRPGKARARDHAADRHGRRRRRFAIALCASDAVITNVDFSRTK